MQGAYESYRRWGAYALSIELKKEFPHYLIVSQEVKDLLSASDWHGFRLLEC